MLWNSLSGILHIAEAFPDKPVWPILTSRRGPRRCPPRRRCDAGFATMRDEMGMNCGLRVELARPSPALEQDLQRA